MSITKLIALVVMGWMFGCAAGFYFALWVASGIIRDSKCRHCGESIALDAQNSEQ